MTDQKLVDELEKALNDEVYDGGMGVLSEEQLSELVRTLASTAAKVAEEALAERSEPQGEPSDAQVDAVAKAIAEAANADYWTDEIAEWEGSEEWEREAHADDHPHTAYEDREEFRKQARAALRAAGFGGTR